MDVRDTFSFARVSLCLGELWACDARGTFIKSELLSLCILWRIGLPRQQGAQGLNVPAALERCAEMFKVIQMSSFSGGRLGRLVEA